MSEDSEDDTESSFSNPAIEDSSPSTEIQKRIVTLVFLAIILVLISLSLYAIITSGVFSEFDLLQDIVSDFRTLS